MSSEWTQALTAFESTIGLRVTLHDHGGGLWKHLPSDRFSHTHPICLAVKMSGEGHRCMTFEIDHYRRDRSRWPEGRVHRCHAGIVELAYTVIRHGEAFATLFAGPARADPRSLDLAAPLGRAADQTRNLTRRLQSLDGEAGRILELLRQLGARLLHLAERESESAAAHGPATRKAIIDRFVTESVSRESPLSLLAGRLGVSPERTRHIVTEEFGRPLRLLISEARMGAAAAMLSGTDLTIAEIANRCGYENPAAFARAFRRTRGVSPSAWRSTHAA